VHRITYGCFDATRARSRTRACESAPRTCPSPPEPESLLKPLAEQSQRALMAAKNTQEAHRWVCFTSLQHRRYLYSSLWLRSAHAGFRASKQHVALAEFMAKQPNGQLRP